MFEIIVKNLENEKESLIKADGYVLMSINRNDEEPDGVRIETCSVDEISNAIAVNGHMRAAARLAIAKYDGLRDVRREEKEEKMEKVLGLLKGMEEEE